MDRLPSYGSKPSRRTFGILVIALAVLALGGVVWGMAFRDESAPPPSPTKSPKAHGRHRPSPSPVPGVTPWPASPAPPISQQVAEIQKLVKIGRPIYCGGGNKPYVALTFDDGPGPYTMKTLDILQAANAGASFFLVGKLVAESWYAKVVRAEGTYAALGDHTWDHVSVVNKPISYMNAQILRTKREIQKVSGQKVYMFRPPYGYFNSYTDRYISKHGMIQMMWSLDSRDSDGANAKQILANIQRGLSPGDIIELHENRGTTLSDLPAILAMIQAQGLIPVNVPQLLALDPPSTAQMRHGTCP